MTVAVSEIAQGTVQDFGPGHFTTSAFTPDGPVLIVFAGVMRDGGAGDPTPSINITDSQGLAWSVLGACEKSGALGMGMRVFVATGAALSSMTVTVDIDGAFDASAWNVHVISYPSGWMPVVGSFGSINDQGALGLNVTVNTARDVRLTSETLAAVFTDNDNQAYTPDQGADYSVLATLQSGDGGNDNLSQVIVRDPGFSSRAALWDDVTPAVTDDAGCACVFEVSADVYAPTAEAWFDLTDTPAEFSSMAAISGEFRYRGVGSFFDYPGQLRLYARIYESDETTPLTNEVLVASVVEASAFTNVTVIFTGVVPGDQADWDGARIRLRWGCYGSSTRRHYRVRYLD
jgi:hypothetical protein